MKRRMTGTMKRCRDCGRLLRFAVLPLQGPMYVHAPGAGKLCREVLLRRAAREEREAAERAWREGHK